MERNVVVNKDDVDPDRGNGLDSCTADALDGDIDRGEEVVPAAMLKSKECIPPKDKAYLHHLTQHLYTSMSIESKLIPHNPVGDEANNT
eukprot:4587236-Ditylum_brightwellii.AAC.1